MPTFDLLISSAAINCFAHKDKLSHAHLHVLRSTTFSQLNQYFSLWTVNAPQKPAPSLAPSAWAGHTST